MLKFTFYHLMKNMPFYLFLLLLLLFCKVEAQPDTAVYHLTIDEKTVNITGKERTGMAINGSIPGPVLEFTEGDYAVIYVKNEMEVETSVHWHGLILPNYFDGVPYLTTPPIRPGETLKYEFPLRQSGTYWYHSHTMLQEQRGVYGPIVILPREGRHDYDTELVLVLSDWTDQQPEDVLRNLKRGNEWYNIRKGTATPLNQVIARGAFGAQLNFWRQRMEGADIADIYYPAFLFNGKQVQDYTDFRPGEKVRLRFINASASSQYWITFGGEDPLLIAADGPDVVPVRHDTTFIAIAETYDFILTIPGEGKVEIRAMVQDGSGTALAYLGRGDTLGAEVLPRPDKIGMMKEMAKMKMRMGAPAMKFLPEKEKPYEMMENWGMKMEHDMGEGKMEHDHSHMHMDHGEEEKEETGGMEMKGKGMFAAYHYDYLEAPEKTAYKADTVREILLNLTGNMWRYVWSMNGIPLSDADMIRIKKGEVVRVTMNNLTMMHHPMHLHGHFFRVINRHGEYSPLKHTVNVPPMKKVVIEFDASETGDWFFHCHVLYHMMGGMARVFSYGTPRDPRMGSFEVGTLTQDDRAYYGWGTVDVASHMSEISLVATNTRNLFMLSGEFGWNERHETELTYEWFSYDYLRFFGGVNAENEKNEQWEDTRFTAIAGIRFFTPYMFDLDVRIDHELRPQISIAREIMIFPRIMLFGEYEYQMYFGWAPEKKKDDEKEKENETVWSAGLEYMLSRNLSVTGSYDNRFGPGGGLSLRF